MWRNPARRLSEPEPMTKAREIVGPATVACPRCWSEHVRDRRRIPGLMTVWFALFAAIVVLMILREFAPTAPASAVIPISVVLAVAVASWFYRWIKNRSAAYECGECHARWN